MSEFHRAVKPRSHDAPLKHACDIRGNPAWVTPRTRIRNYGCVRAIGSPRRKRSRTPRQDAGDILRDVRASGKSQDRQRRSQIPQGDEVHPNNRVYPLILS
jgi:hypothetical protein